jgi:protoheme IX farnesyltransferase
VLTSESPRIRDFITLVKPEITFMVLISAAVACLIASEQVKLVVLLNTVVGTSLLAAGAATLNQFLERVLDGRMRRTSMRPLPSGRLSALTALSFGLSLSAGGTIYLFFFLNALTSLLGLFTLLSYLFVYTPLKRKSSLCTLVGAIPGAAPILIGWAAAGNSIGPKAWALYAVLFLWQFPHFYSIGWLYREDYARAGMLMLPALDTGDGEKTFHQILVSTELLIIATAILAITAHMGCFYLFVTMVLDLSLYYFAYRASKSRSKVAAKRLLHASIIFLPLLYLLTLVDKFHLLTTTS